MKGVSQVADSALDLLTGSERLKSKGVVILNIFAALLAVNVWFNSHLTAKVMNNTITASDTWSYYQAKSIKELMCELTAKTTDKKELAKDLVSRAAKYSEGEKKLFDQGKALEADRDNAKLRLPWVGYANTIYQIAIVMLSASILTSKRSLYYGSFAAAGVGVVLMCQGLFLIW